MSDCAAGTIASVIAINEAGDRGDIWAHTEYSSSSLTLHGCNTKDNISCNGLWRKGPQNTLPVPAISQFVWLDVEINLYGKMLKPRQINNQFSETANHWLSLTFDLAHALIGFTFAPRLYTRNVRLFVQFYICCIFTPSLSPSLTVQQQLKF